MGHCVSITFRILWLVMAPLTASADAFVAIAHPLRRALLEHLAHGERAASELAEPFGVSRPAVSQHLRVLVDAGLATERRDGRRRLYSLEVAGLQSVREWLGIYERFWRRHFSNLTTYLEETSD
jgi:DNA-binding transcriptional ArsR family regulator